MRISFIILILLSLSRSSVHSHERITNKIVRLSLKSTTLQLNEFNCLLVALCTFSLCLFVTNNYGHLRLTHVTTAIGNESIEAKERKNASKIFYLNVHKTRFIFFFSLLPHRKDWKISSERKHIL